MRACVCVSVSVCLYVCVCVRVYRRSWPGQYSELLSSGGGAMSYARRQIFTWRDVRAMEILMGIFVGACVCICVCVRVCVCVCYMSLFDPHLLLSMFGSGLGLVQALNERRRRREKRRSEKKKKKYL